MATGFQSNFNDSGYLIQSGNLYYDESGNQITATSIQSRDIYTSSQQVGVYMINGSQSNNFGSTYPIFGSLSNMNNASIQTSIDDAWVVYPGYGFQLFQLTNYGSDSNSPSSNIYINTSSVPVLFRLVGGYNAGTAIKTITGIDYPDNSTVSVKIYFRFQQIFIIGLS